MKNDQNIVHAESENQALLDEINLIGNGEFESTLKNTWDVDTYTESSLEIDQTNHSPVSQDNSSLKIGIGSGKWEYGKYLPAISQTIKVLPNKTYRLGLWSKFKGEGISTHAEFYLYDSNGTIIWKKNEEIDPSQSWSEFELVIPKFANADSIKVSINTSRGFYNSSYGELWLDTISLKETNVNLATSIMNNWNINNNSSTSGTITKDTTNNFSVDEYSYKHSVSAGSWEIDEALPSQEALIPIDGNSIYNVQLANKGSSPDIFISLTYTFLNESQTYITSGNRTVVPTTNWNLYNEYINTPKNAKYVQIEISTARSIFSSSSSGNVWLSPNLQVSKVSLNYNTSTEFLNDGEFNDESMFNDWIIPSNSIGSISKEKNGHGGDYSVKFNYSAGDFGFGKELYAIHEVNVEPNTVYNFSAWSKVLSNTTIDSDIKLEFYEDDYTYINDALTSDTLEFSNSTSWNKRELTFKTSPSTNKIKITIQTHKASFMGDTQPGSVLFDSISLIKKIGESSFLPIYPIDGTNIIKNESFVDGTNNWNISHVNDDSSVVIDNDFVGETNDGNSLKVNVKPLSNDYGNVLIKQTIAVEPNTSYVFEGYTKGININNSIIRFNAEINNRSGTEPERYYYKVPYAPTSDNEEWVKKILAFKTGANATSVTITLQVSYPDNKATGSVIFDNLKLAKSNNELNEYDYSPLGGLMPFKPDQSLGQIFDDINSNQINWDEFRIQMAENNKLIESAVKDLDLGLAQINSGLAQMNTALDDFDKAVNDLNATVDDLNISLNEINVTIDGLNLILFGTGITVNGKVVSQRELEELLGKNNSNPQGLIGTINGLNSNVDDFSRILKNINRDVNNANSQTDRLTVLINNYNNDLSTLNGSIRELDQFFDEYNKDISSFGDVLYEMSDTFNDISYHVDEYILNGVELEKIINGLVNSNITDLNFLNIDMSGFTLEGMDIASQFPSRPRTDDIDARMELLLDLLPVVGEIKAAAELGMTIYNGENLGTRGYVLAALGVVGGGKVKGTVKVSGPALSTVDEVTNGIKITENYRKNYKAYTGYNAKGEVHHGLPKEKSLRAWFRGKGIDVQDPKYLYDLPKELHRYSDYDGIHTKNSPLGKDWNAIWQEYMRKYPDATKKDIENKLNEMEQKANIADRRAKPKK